MQGQATTHQDQEVKARTPRTHPVARRIERETHTASEGERREERRFVIAFMRLAV